MSKKRIIFFIVLALLILPIVVYFLIPQENFNPSQKVEFGVTFSKDHAEYFNLNWQEVYLAILDDLKIKHLRLPAYWDEIEPQEGVYSFGNLDWQVEQADSRGGDIILAVGRKLPRWPECRLPSWAKTLSAEKIKQKKLEMIEKVVEHYKNYPNIIAWQIENEPFFPFGECKKFNRKEIKEEMNLVKSIDNQPIILTDSGELSSWFRIALFKPDILGISTYRVVYNKYVGYFHHFFPSNYYLKKSFLIKNSVDKLIVTELQAEPWGNSKPVKEMTSQEQDKSMSLKQMENNIQFAKQMGFSYNYFWGVEWWYWRKVNGDDRFWELVKDVIVK